MYSPQGKFQQHFQCKKVQTILDKIRYFRKSCEFTPWLKRSDEFYEPLPLSKPVTLLTTKPVSGIVCIFQCRRFFKKLIFVKIWVSFNPLELFIVSKGFFLSVWVCLFVYLSICLSVCLSVSICLSVCLSVYHLMAVSLTKC